MTFTAKAGSDPAHVTEAVKRAVATATAEFAQPGSEPLVKLTGFSPYGIEVQALAFTRDGVFPMPLLETLVKTLRADAQEISRIPHPAEFDRYFDL